VNWLERTLDNLAQQPAIGYEAGSVPAAEPTALAALALAAHGRGEAARQAGAALVAMQGTSGAVGVRSGEPTPGWPSSLAIVAWQVVDPIHFRERIDRAVAWLLANRGKSIERSPDFGHNTELVGWAYAEQTHSWVEPTAFAVLGLRAVGMADHPATREGVAILLDRQLPGGGLNYGNTMVLGQFIRPHVQPTGIALLALAGHRSPQAPREAVVSRSETITMGSDRTAKSIAWLRRSIGPETTPLSLGWAILGLRAHDAEPPQADEWLAAAARRASVSLAHAQAGRVCYGSSHKLALLALAAKGWPG
jgi:hypothetical protein